MSLIKLVQVIRAEKLLCFFHAFYQQIHHASQIPMGQAYKGQAKLLFPQILLALIFE